jgi:toxin HigB-1
VIISFKDKITQAVLQRLQPHSLSPDIARAGFRKLIRIDAAVRLDDLRSPPGNRLETLRGDREDRHSVRINQQYRICFVWTPEGVRNVEITDDH